MTGIERWTYVFRAIAVVGWLGSLVRWTYHGGIPAKNALLLAVSVAAFAASIVLERAMGGSSWPRASPPARPLTGSASWSRCPCSCSGSSMMRSAAGVTGLAGPRRRGRSWTSGSARPSTTTSSSTTTTTGPPPPPPPTTTTTRPTTTTAPPPAATGSVPDAIRQGFARFGPAVAEQAVRVAWCESEHVERATGALGERGVLQLHPVHRELAARLGYTWDEMYLAGPNAVVAAALYESEGWRPWACRGAA